MRGTEKLGPVAVQTQHRATERARVGEEDAVQTRANTAQFDATKFANQHVVSARHRYGRCCANTAPFLRHELSHRCGRCCANTVPFLRHELSHRCGKGCANTVSFLRPRALSSLRKMLCEHSTLSTPRSAVVAGEMLCEHSTLLRGGASSSLERIMCEHSTLTALRSPVIARGCCANTLPPRAPKPCHRWKGCCANTVPPCAAEYGHRYPSAIARSARGALEHTPKSKARLPRRFADASALNSNRLVAIPRLCSPARAMENRAPRAAPGMPPLRSARAYVRAGCSAGAR